MPCARVVLTTGNRTVTGAILTVEERTSQIDANKPPVATRRVLLASDTGDFASFDFSGVQGLRLLDDGARQGVREFANVTALARRRNARTIVVTSEGTGPRELVVSYTVPTPIWKTAYRVVLDDSLSRSHAWLLARWFPAAIGFLATGRGISRVVRNVGTPRLNPLGKVRQ